MDGQLRKPAVTFYHRKPRKVGNYSVEFIFSDIRERLKDKINSRVANSRFESSGLFKRIYNCFEAAFRQSDVNHVTGDINYLGLLLNKKKTVQTILDCVHLSNSSGIKHKVLKFFWVTLPIKRAVLVTAISESTRNEILKYTQCDPQKIRVVHVAISEKFRSTPKTFNADCPRILQVGTAPNKNIPRLIEALEGIPCILEIIGKHNPEYELLLQQKKVKYEYKWGLSDDEMISRYAAADIIALVSTYEGFGMPILEGQAVGRPVITSNIFSMPEVAGNAAAIVDPFDVESIRSGLLHIIKDQTYRENLVKNGFENIKRFSPERIAADYLDIYQQIAERKIKN